MVKMETRACQAKMEMMVFLAGKACLDQRVRMAKMEHLAHRVSQDLKDQQGHQDPGDVLGKRDLQDLQVHLDLQDLRVRMDQTDHLAQQDLRALMELVELKVPWEARVYRVHKERQDLQAQEVYLDPRAL